MDFKSRNDLFFSTDMSSDTPPTSFFKRRFIRALPGAFFLVSLLIAYTVFKDQRRQQLKGPYRGVQWSNRVGDKMDSVVEDVVDGSIEVFAKDQKARCDILQEIVEGLRPKLPIISREKKAELRSASYDPKCLMLIYDYVAYGTLTSTFDPSLLAPTLNHLTKLEFSKGCKNGTSALSEAGIGTIYRYSDIDGKPMGQTGPFHSQDCPK
jgi:hypothetical protein